MEGQRTALDIKYSLPARRVHTHLTNVRIAAIEMVLNDGKLEGETIDAAAAAHDAVKKEIVTTGEYIAGNTIPAFKIVSRTKVDGVPASGLF